MYIYIYIYIHTHIYVYTRVQKSCNLKKYVKYIHFLFFSNQKVSLFDKKTKDMYFMYIFKLHLWKGVYILFYLHDIKQIVDPCKDVTDIDILWTG